MNSLILLPLLLAAAMAAPMSNGTARMNNHGIYNPLQYSYYPGVYGGSNRQGVPGITIMAQQAAAALSNLQLYFTVQKWNSILCLLDSTCPQVVLPPHKPGQTTTTTTTVAPTTTTTTTAVSTTTTTTTAAPTTPTITSCTTTGNCGELCSGVTASSGVVQSPDYPNDYGLNRNCIILIEGSSTIKLEFTTFNLENGFDLISVYDDSNFIYKDLTGTTIPAAVTTTTNKMKISFYSEDINDNPPYFWQGTFTAV